MRILLPAFLIAVFFLHADITFAQLQSAANGTKSNFKAEFLRKRKTSHDKTSACGKDTLKYAQFNAVTDRYISINPAAVAPTTATFGVGVCFQIDDTVRLEGFNFYAISQNTNSQIKCNVYYAAPDHRPAGLPIYSDTITLASGLIYLPWMFQNIMFNNTITLVSDFVITVEAIGTATLVFAGNDWITHDGKGNKFTSIKFAGGWSNNVTVGTDQFDADFYFEPVVSYKMSAKFDHGPNSCIGNGKVFDFVNKTSFALNPQYSPDVISNSLEDNFTWDYGDGAPLDTALHGSHNYTITTDYLVTLTADFQGWINSCQDDTTMLVEEADVNANFQTSASGLTATFTDKSTDALQWNWDFGDGSNGSVKASPTHIYDNYGTYQVKQIVRNKGCSDSITLSIILDPTGIAYRAKSEQSDIVISPVPAYDYLDLRVIDYEGGGRWSIFNLQGRIMAANDLLPEQRIQIDQFNQGVYFLKVETPSGNVITRRFTVL